MCLTTIKNEIMNIKELIYYFKEGTTLKVSYSNFKIMIKKCY